MRSPVALWVLACLALLAFLVRLPAGAISSNLMDLLPSQERDPTVERALSRISADTERRVVLLVKAHDMASLTSEVASLDKTLDRSGLFARAHVVPLDYAGLFAYRYVLVDSADRAAIRAGTAATRARQELAGPAGVLRAADLKRDPLFLFQHYTSTLLPAVSDMAGEVPVIRRDGMLYGVVTRDVTVQAQGLSGQRHLYSFLTALKRRRAPDLMMTGFPAFAAYGAYSANRDISTIGTLSIAATILLVWFVFRHLLPLVLIVATVTTGVLVACVATYLSFGRLHVLTLVAGTSLIGLSIDYCFHYFCSDADTPPQGSPRSHILRALTLGMASSVGAYLLLLLAPFPGLRQMSVFSASGLFATWLTVILVFPAIYRGRPGPAAAVAQAVHDMTRRVRQILVARRLLIAPLLIAVAAAGIWQLRPADDVRLLQTPPPGMTRDDQEIRAVLHDIPDSRFLLIEGTSPEDVASTSQRVSRQLATLRRRGGLGAYRSLFSAWPTRRQQTQNYLELEHDLYDNGVMRNYLSTLGFSRDNIDAEYRDFAQASGKALSLDEWTRMVPPPWNALWLGCQHDHCGAIILLYGLSHPDAVKALSDDKQVVFVDKVGAASRVMQRTRVLASWLICAAVCALFAAMTPILGIGGAVRVTAIPVAAIVLSLGAIGILGVPFSLFNVFALLLVLGIGVDYAVFNHLAGASDRNVSLAVFLSAATTMLAFGLLALSHTAAISAFGLTLLFGILAALLLSPLARVGDQP